MRAGPDQRMFLGGTPASSHDSRRRTSRFVSNRVIRVKRRRRSVRLYIRGIDFDADSLANQVNREHEPRFVVLADESAHYAPQRSVNNFDHHSFLEHRTWVKRQIALDQ